MRPIHAALVAVLLAGASPAVLAQGRAPEKPSAPSKPATRSREARVVDLRPKFTKDQEIKLTMEMTERLIPSGKTKQSDKALHDVKQEFGLVIRVRATNPDEGSTLEITFESVKFRGTMGGEAVNFDSTRPAKSDDPMGEVLRSLVGVSTTVDVDPAGNVRSASASGGLAGGLGGGLGGMGGAGMGIEKLGGASDIFKSLLGPVQSSGGNRTGLASVGETWTDQTRMPAPGGTWTIKSTQTLRSASGPRAYLDLNGTIALDPPSQGGGVGAKLSDTRYQGTTVWDTDQGFLERMDTTIRATYTLTTPSVKALDEGQEGFPTSGTIEKTLKVTRK